jgi:hypothetical protein
MSIYGGVIALSLTINSSAAIVFDTSPPINVVQKVREISQSNIIPLEEFDDGIKAGREELARLIKTVRSYPKFTPEQKAFGVARLYFDKSNEFNSAINSQLLGARISQETKIVILKRWEIEREALKQMAFQEEDPFLTAKEREARDFFTGPGFEALKKRTEVLVEQRRREDQIRANDAEKLRGILPSQ